MATSSRGATPRTPPPTKPPRLLGGMLWLLTGLLIGGMLTWLWCNFSNRPAASCASAGGATPRTASSADGGDETSAPTPHFDFYNILSHQPSVAATASGTPASAPAPAPAPASPPAPEHTPSATAPDDAPATPAPAETAAPTPPQEHATYILQSGSFHTEAEADQRRAQILMLGLAVTIQPVVVDGQPTWYRVIAGPFPDAAAAATAKKHLQEQGIASIGIRKKP